MKNLSIGQDIYKFLYNKKGIATKQSAEEFYVIEIPPYREDLNPKFEDFYSKVSFQISGVYVQGGWHLYVYKGKKKYRTVSSDYVYQDLDSVREKLGEKYIEDWKIKRREAFQNRLNYTVKKIQELEDDKVNLTKILQTL